MSEKCMRCNEEGEDRRTLWMACLYEMMELELPFEREILIEEIVPDFSNKKREFFTLRVCKDCRADWMKTIKSWFDRIPARKSTGTDFFIREYGTTRELTEEEVKELTAKAIEKSIEKNKDALDKLSDR
jgi:hypothetical protein